MGDDDENETSAASSESVTSSAAGKTTAVETELRQWLTRSADQPKYNAEGKMPTMLQFWQSQPDSLLKRVARRAGAMMLSQCTTERTNKIPKDIWTHDRRSVAPESMARDVFVYTNLHKYPEAK